MIRMHLAGILLLLFTLQGVVQGQGSDSYSVTVSAGAFDRVDAIVSFPLPDRTDDGIYLMEDESDNSVYLQVKDSEGHFIVESLGAGDSKTYTLRTDSEAGRSSGERITSSQDSPSLTFQAGGNDIVNYFYNESELPEGINSRFRRSGYIHPLYTPDGVRVTQHFNPNRPHQYGIWTSWYRAEFQDRTPEFWGGHEDNGRIQAEALEEVWEGPVYGGFRAKHRFVDYSVPEPVTALNEQWEVFVYQPTRDDSYNIIDINVIQTTNTNNPIEFHEHIYGGMNVRGHDEWNGEGEMNYTSSEGLDRTDVISQGVRWSHMGGDIEGNVAGLGIFGHPDNPRHPLGVFINATEPFFSYGPVSLGDLRIEPGTPWSTRFRFITHDGEPDTEEIEQMWNDYAYPPAVTVSRNN